MRLSPNPSRCQHLPRPRQTRQPSRPPPLCQLPRKKIVWRRATKRNPRMRLRLEPHRSLPITPGARIVSTATAHPSRRRFIQATSDDLTRHVHYAIRSSHRQNETLGQEINSCPNVFAYFDLCCRRCLARSAATCALLGPVCRYISATPQSTTSAMPINCAVAMPLIIHASGRWNSTRKRPKP